MMDSSPLKLAFCITELYIGGAERALCELAIRLDKTRFSVTVYSLQARPENDTMSCVPRLEAAGISVRFLNMHGRKSFPIGFFRLRKFLKEQQPDCVLSFLFHANLLSRLAAWSLGIKHVFSGIRVAEKKARWHLTFDRWTSRLVEKYVCVSHSVATFSETVGRLPKEKIVVIPNGIDVTPFSLPVEKRNWIIFIGRLTQQKGVDWLVNTAPHWLLKLPDWKLVIVGDGEERDGLLIRIKSGNDYEGSESNQIVLTGWRADAAKLLTMSKILVLPSRWEGMPNVVLQAMAAGIPVVATEVEGISELLGENAADQTCRFGDDKMLTERILTLATDSDLAEQLGNKNRNRAKQFFSMETVVRSYEELFVTQ
ncbi:MAG: glycosyltransferase [Planctomycetaceae bacterium]|jgi:glycosyltransferase involved in cell wall biosynthesis|nr:glycosyltransferase [Planctomycetaceae bacterium]